MIQNIQQIPRRLVCKNRLSRVFSRVTFDILHCGLYRVSVSFYVGTPNAACLLQ